MDRKVIIIDRSLPELIRTQTVDKQTLIYFTKRLFQLGVNILEINAKTLFLIKNTNINFIYRVTSKEDLKGLKKIKLNTVLVNYQDISKLKDDLKDLKLILEIYPSELNCICNYGGIENLMNLYSISTLRIVGLHNLDSFKLIDKALEIRELYNLKIDICPSNKSGMATAIAFEAFEKGVDYITTSFCGYGGTKGFAALEEVILALKVLCGIDKASKTSFLSKLAEEFEEITHRHVALQKPILGKAIFKCESGIHVHGIIRDSSTYEPYEPELVGKYREIVLGKHSGRSIFRQVAFKLHY